MHPYRDRPDRAFWRRSVTGREWDDVPFGAEPDRFVTADSRIATAGSCFASNLLRWLPRLGLQPFFAEQPPLWFTDDEARTHGYRDFGARYGNIYTARQLRRLVEEAFELRPMFEEFAEGDDGVADLLRPHVRPGGFGSIEEARLDRSYHLACVRRLLCECQVFVFTLGLTEAWIDDRSGVVFPVCPGTAAGEYEPAHHRPVNFDYPSVVDDLDWVIDAVGARNPDLRWILTVSPVPLVATHADQSVVVATAYSKAVLRAAAGAVAERRPEVTYFPSYEIIASPQSMGRYLAPDLRDVTDEGVAHVMRTFQAMLVETTTGDVEPRPAAPAPPDDPWEATRAALEAECDELLNDYAP